MQSIQLSLYLFGLCIMSALCCAQEYSTFFVYTADSTNTPWGFHLQNTDAYNVAGLMVYLHTNIIPSKSAGKANDCYRNGRVNAIMKYEVTVSNPLTRSTPPIDGYMQFEGGQCITPDCEKIFKKEGYFVGMKAQIGATDHAYQSVAEYSFPGSGICMTPNGSPNCTYVVRPVGQLYIDDFVNARDVEITPDYRAWCKAGGVEFHRNYPDHLCEVIQSISFWKGVCNVEDCTKRLSIFETIPDRFNYTLSNGCDGSTGRAFRDINRACVRECTLDTYLAWDYTCLPCQSNLHCKTCNWPQFPADKGGNCCTSCPKDYPILKDCVCVKK